MNVWRALDCQRGRSLLYKAHKHTIAGAEYSQPVPGVRLIKARSFEQEVAEREGREGLIRRVSSGGDLVNWPNIGGEMRGPG